MVVARQYLLVNVICGTIPFLMLPVLTRYLSPEDFGIVALYTSIVAVVSAVFTLGVNGAVSRIYFDLSEKGFADFVGACLVLILISTIGFSILISIFSHQIENGSKFPASWLWAVIITACAQAVLNVGLAVFQVRNMVRQFAVVQVFQIILLAIVAIVLVVFLDYDWRGRISAQIISVSTAAVGLLYYL